LPNGIQLPRSPFGTLIVSGFSAFGCGLCFTCPDALVGRGFRFVFWGFSGVIRNIPTGPFKVERAMGNKLVQFARTMSAFGQGLFGKFLNDLFNFTAIIALVLVHRHILDFLLILSGSNVRPSKNLA
jgi:hypothetical protein